MEVGTFKVTAAISGRIEEFLVNTGATYSSVPEDILVEIGVKPIAHRKVVLANGVVETVKVGECCMAIEGSPENFFVPIVFGPPGSPLLLGATALETFSLGVDPVGRRLVPVTAMLALRLPRTR